MLPIRIARAARKREKPSLAKRSYIKHLLNNPKINLNLTSHSSINPIVNPIASRPSKTQFPLATHRPASLPSAGVGTGKKQRQNTRKEEARGTEQERRKEERERRTKQPLRTFLPRMSRGRQEEKKGRKINNNTEEIDGKKGK